MSDKKAFLIVDYNLSRIEDVKKIKNYINQKHDMNLILIRNNPSLTDFKIANHVLNLDPLKEGFTKDALEEIEKLNESIIGGLVFSDNAVHSGAKLLEKLELLSDCADLAENAFCKYLYRKEETYIKPFLEAQGLFIPNVKKILNREDLNNFINENKDGVIIKPTKEGNNRGVILLKKPTPENIDIALNEVSKYIHDGIIAEQLIPFEHEYSFDGIGDSFFITEKISSKGRYPVEYGQLIPARIDKKRKKLIKKAGELANLIVGQRIGAFHNEILVDSDNKKVAVVEANRRPAGMKIWDLANHVFNENMYERWVDSVLFPNKIQNELKVFGSAMTIMFPSSKTVLFKNIRDIENCINELEQSFERKFPKKKSIFKWGDKDILIKENTPIYYPPRSGEDFIFSIILYSIKESSELFECFDLLQKEWRNVLNEYFLKDENYKELKDENINIA